VLFSNDLRKPTMVFKKGVPDRRGEPDRTQRKKNGLVPAGKRKKGEGPGKEKEKGVASFLQVSSTRGVEGGSRGRVRSRRGNFCSSSEKEKKASEEGGKNHFFHSFTAPQRGGSLYITMSEKRKSRSPNGVGN